MGKLKITSLIGSLKRTLYIMLADVRMLISFYVARSMIRRALAAERREARENFSALKKLQELETE